MGVLDEVFTLSNGVTVPKLGFGTWQIQEGQEAYDAVQYALEAGYRHIDTAFVYGNEKSVGHAVRQFGAKDVFVTSKIPAEIKTYKGAREHFERSVESLNLGKLDLMLIHAPWPWSRRGKSDNAGNIEVWQALNEYYEAGRVRSIGVSNFAVHDLQNLIGHGVKPMVNQISLFIGQMQDEIVSYCDENGILVEGYSPLATGRLSSDGRIAEIAKKYGVTFAQICIRYLLQHNILPLPKSTHRGRIIENAAVDFEISEADMRYLDSLTADQK